MPVAYNPQLKTTRMQAVINAIDAAGTAATGTIEIGTRGLGLVLAKLTLLLPSFTQSTAGIIIMSGVPLSANAIADGIAGSAQINDRNGNAVVSGLSVGTSGTDIIIDSMSISTGQLVTLTSAVLTHA
jgi:hypothetical protein